MNGLYHGYPIVRLVVNGAELIPPVPAVILNNSVVVPARALAEALGAQVKWDPASYTVSVTGEKARPDRAFYTPADLKGSDLWQESGWPETAFHGAMPVGTALFAAQLERYLKVAESLAFSVAAKESHRSELNSRPVIFGYVRGAETAGLDQLWPYSKSMVDALLTQEEGIVLLGHAAGPERLLFAARSTESLTTLLTCAFAGESCAAPATEAPPAGPSSWTEPGVTPPAPLPGSVYTPADLAGKTVLQAAGISSGRLDGAAVVGSRGAVTQIQSYISTGPGTNFFGAQGDDWQARLAAGPAIIAYVQGESVGRVADFLPIPLSQVTSLLLTEPAFAAYGMVQGHPRLLLAARSNTHMLRLLTCALATECPALHRERVAPWSDVMSARPAWASAALVIDLRQPFDNGTAVVYLEAPATRLLAPSVMHQGSNLRATFNPADGGLRTALPDTDSALRTDEGGRLIYEVQPYFRPSGIRSNIYSDMAYITSTALLPEFGFNGNRPVAVRWLLPPGWSMNVPWPERDGWQVMQSDDNKGTGTMLMTGRLAIHEFTVGETRYRLSQPAELSAATQEENARFFERSIRHLTERLGPPPTPYERYFTLNLLHRRLVDGGTAGHRSMTTKNDRKVALHEAIHWWLGVGFQSEVRTWHESLTEFMAIWTMRELGHWSESEYQSFLMERGAVRESYPPLRNAQNYYGDEALAFMRDLDAYIREGSKGSRSVFDIIRHFHASPAYGYGQTLTYDETLKLIEDATGVDPRPFFAKRY